MATAAITPVSTAAAVSTVPAVMAPSTTIALPAVPTTAPVTAAVPTSSVAGTFAGERESEWCLRAAELNLLTTAFRQSDAADRDAVRESLATILDRIGRIAAVVPPEIADDLAVSSDAFAMLDAALAQVGYDFAEADLSELDARTAEIGAANEVIRRYNHDVCGLDAGVTGQEVP